VKTEEWYAARKDEAQRRVDWSEKLGTLLGPQLETIAGAMAEDPVTGDAVLSITLLHGPRGLVSGYQLQLLGEELLLIRVAAGAKTLEVRGARDVYPSIEIVDVKGTAPGEVSLDYTTDKTRLPSFATTSVRNFIGAIVEARLRA
jgi:hypothetical protein